VGGLIPHKTLAHIIPYVHADQHIVPDLAHPQSWGVVEQELHHM